VRLLFTYIITLLTPQRYHPSFHPSSTIITKVCIVFWIAAFAKNNTFVIVETGEVGKRERERERERERKREREVRDIPS